MEYLRHYFFYGFIFSVSLYGCSGGSDGNGSSNVSNPAESKFTIHVNKGDPQLLKAQTASGFEIDYFGERDTEGLATRFTSINVTDPQGNSTVISLDVLGRPKNVLSDDNSSYEFNYTPNDKAVVTAISADGTEQVITEINYNNPAPNTSLLKVTQVAPIAMRNMLNDSGRVYTTLNSQLPVNLKATSKTLQAKALSTLVAITATVSSCGKPVENANVTIFVDDAGSDPEGSSFKVLANNAGGGKYIKNIPVDGVNLAGAREVCNTIDTVQGATCTVAQPLAAGMVAGGCAAYPPAFAACISTFEAVLVGCTALNPSPIPGTPSALTQICQSDIQSIANIFFRGELRLSAHARIPGSIGSGFSPLFDYDPFNEGPPILPIDIMGAPILDRFFTLPVDPTAAQNYIATVKVSCAVPNTTVTISVSGDDGYSDSGTCVITDGFEACNLDVPGGEAGVRDTIRVEINGVLERTISVTF